jgi:hypothetical protein
MIPTKGHPDHSTATEPKKIDIKKLFSNHEEKESMTNDEQTAEGRYAVDERKMPGDERRKKKVYHSIVEPNTLQSERRKDLEETAKNNPRMFLMRRKSEGLSRWKDFQKRVTGRRGRIKA